jgi:hypothetical protein
MYMVNICEVKISSMNVLISILIHMSINVKYCSGVNGAYSSSLPASSDVC